MLHLTRPPPSPKQQHNKGLIYFLVFYFSHLSMTNLNATNGGFQSKLCNRRKPKTPPTKPPTHATIICKLVVKGSKVLRKGMQDSLKNYIFKVLQSTTPTHLHNPLTQLTTLKTYI